MTDQQIIEQLRSGKNDKAFLALYKHFPMIRKMVLSKGGRKEDAEDIFQEALLVVHRKVNAEDFTLTAQLSTYLYSVCRFLWKDELKKRQKLPAEGIDSGLAKAEEESMTEWRQEEEKLGMARQVIEGLGERCRELLLLFYSGTMKLKAIAVKMGYNSENTAKNQKYKCLEAARNRLKQMKKVQAS